MILKHTEVRDATVAKLVAKLLRKNPPSVQKFKIKTRFGDKVITYEDILQFMDTLSAKLDSGDYEDIRRCDTCGNFSRSARSPKGWCSPSNRDFYKDKRAYCSDWIPMSEQQKYVREVLNERKTERVGTVAKNRKKGN